MYTEYLKTQLQRIIDAGARIAEIESRYATVRDGHPCYPSMCGAMQSELRMASDEAKRALAWTVNHIEPAEREAGRLISILEALDIDLDEETLSTLELIGRDQTYKEARRDIRNAINKAVNDTQWCERDYEHDQAIDALAAAGFVVDDDGEVWTRGDESVTVTLVSGRDARYEWTYDSDPSAAHDTDPDAIIDSGKSGEFFRLLALIAKPATVEVTA